MNSALVLMVVVSWSGVPAAERMAVDNGVGPTFKSIGPLAFSPDGVLLAGNTQSAAILALDLGKAATGGAPGATAIPAFDQKVAALVGTDVREITVTDLAVHPKTRNAFASVMRGQGNNAQPALLRIDGAGQIDVVALGDIKFSRVELPNAPAANPDDRRNSRTQSITTVFFDPGRQKRGIAPIADMGRSLTEGKSYTLVIDAGWRDGNGLLLRALGVIAPDGKSLAGDVTVGPGEVMWTFTPKAAWQGGDYQLVAFAMLATRAWDA